MKKLITLLFLAVGLTAAAQNSARYDHFKELRNEADTTGMKKMLEEWGEKDPEYYSAWANYCTVMAEETEDPTWKEMAVNWVRMGRDDFPDNELLLHKQAEVLFENDRFQEAFPILQEIEKRGIGDILTWYQLSIIYGGKGDYASSRKYLEKMIEEGDEEDREYALSVLADYDEMDRQADSLAIHPDHAAIKAFAETPAFQELTARFAACDTTLTLNEIATLYYGSAYQKEYNLVQEQCDDIRQMAGEGKIKEAVEALNAKLEEYPVSLFLLISLFNLTEGEEMVPYLWKAQQILSVIDCTGRVDSTEVPFQVICVNDEYMALNQILEMSEFKEQALVERADFPLDRMTFLNAYGLEMTVYFRITPPYWERMNSLFGNND